MTTAGSFSAHLVDSYMNSQIPRGPFGQPLNIATHGPMSFAPQMHGSFSSAFGTQQSSSFFSEPSFMEMTEESAKKIAELQVKLNKKLGPEYISQRPGPGGGPKLTYAEGWKIINLANEVFGFNGWSSNIVSITTDFVDYSEESRRYNVGVTAIVRVSLRDGVYHEDVGYGLLENAKSKGAALDKCKKEAVTDAVKRTLRNFGNLLGNCLYDKAYTQEVVKIKVQPPKFDRAELHRRPEFDQTQPPNAGPSTASTSYASSSAAGPSRPIVKSEPDASAMPPPPLIPNQHARMPPPNSTSTPNAKGKAPMAPAGLPTPMQTPVGVTAQARAAQASANVGGMAQRNAERHAARLKAIQDAQEAQRREDEVAAQAAAAQSSDQPLAPEPNVPQEVPSTSATTSIQPPPRVLPKTSTTSALDSDDFFHFPSDDDAYFANLDMNALDEGVGGPIDYDEGTSAAIGPDPDDDASMSGTSASTHAGVAVSERAVPPQPPQPPQPQAQQAQRPPQQQRSRVTSGGSARPSTSHQNQNIPPANHAPPAKPSSSSERPRTPSMGGGFSFPSGGAPPSRAPSQIPPRVATSSSSSSSVGVKRNADIMQGINAGLAQARRPQQGMGLQNPPGGGGAAARREPLAALELGEGGDVKRLRRS